MILLAYLFVLHFIADFLCQSREMGQKKSSEWRWLASHLLIQFSFFLFGMGIWSFFMFVPAPAILVIPVLNTIVHGIIDWNIWRLYKLSAHRRISKTARIEALGEVDWNVPFHERFKKHYDLGVKNWQYYNDHWFYSTIGLDQLLHALTIIALVGMFT